MTSAATAATIRLGLMLSVVAAGVAAGLSLIGDVTEWSLVLTVATIGFVASWIQSGRFARSGDEQLAVVVTAGRIRQTLG